MNAGRVLVTGAAGFVGANLVRDLLDRDWTVHAIARPETRTWRLDAIAPRLVMHRLDLRDASRVSETVDAVQPQVIVHLATHRGNPDTIDYPAAYDANLGGTLHLLQAAAALGGLTRFVHAGSSLEYDLSRSPLREDDASVPMTIHGVTKAAASRLCQHFAVRHQVPVVVLRLFTIYGPWEAATRFVPQVMMSALGGSPLRLTRPGLDHDWIHVDDIVDACRRAMSCPGIVGEILNIATGRPSTNEDVVRLVEECAGHALSRGNEPFPQRPWDTDRWVADVDKARALMGWTAATSLRDGLSRTLAWFREHHAEYATTDTKVAR